MTTIDLCKKHFNTTILNPSSSCSVCDLIRAQNKIEQLEKLIETIENDDAPSPGTPSVNSLGISNEERAKLYFASQPSEPQKETIGRLVDDFNYVQKSAIRKEHIRLSLLISKILKD